MSPISISGGDTIPLVMVVEYLESTMSKDLLGKFPDNSAFDYAQSSIWSPLLPRPPPNSVFFAGGLEISKRLTYGDSGDRVGLLGNTKKMAARIKRNLTDTVVENIGRCGKMKRRKRLSFGLSHVGSDRRLSSSSQTMPKAWVKVMMTTAAKKFKKRTNKHKDQNVHSHLSNYFTS